MKIDLIGIAMDRLKDVEDSEEDRKELLLAERQKEYEELWRPHMHKIVSGIPIEAREGVEIMPPTGPFSEWESHGDYGSGLRFNGIELKIDRVSIWAYDMDGTIYFSQGVLKTHEGEDYWAPADINRTKHELDGDDFYLILGRTYREYESVMKRRQASAERVVKAAVRNLSRQVMMHFGELEDDVILGERLDAGWIVEWFAASTYTVDDTTQSHQPCAVIMLARGE